MLSLFKQNLSFIFSPFDKTNSNGIDTYSKIGIVTTINYEGAAALYIVANNIINGRDEANGAVLTIPCAGGASLTLERTRGGTGKMESYLLIKKNDMSAYFAFNTHEMEVKENNQMVVREVERGLGVFAKTLEGYLTGINADGHISKLAETLEEYQKADRLEEGQPKRPFSPSWNSLNYPKHY
jgi:hypothetical protein